MKRKHAWLGVGLVAGGMLWITSCGKHEADVPTSGLATQGASAEAASTYADANLAELTREVRRWIIATKKRPGSFEEVMADAQIAVPPPPPGKKYVLSREMRVILVNEK